MTIWNLCDYVSSAGPPPKSCPDLQNWLIEYTQVLVATDRFRIAEGAADPLQQDLTDLYLPCDAPPNSIVVWDNTTTNLQTFWFNIEGSALGGLWRTIDVNLFPANISVLEWSTYGVVGGGVVTPWTAMPGAPSVNLVVSGEGYVLCGYNITTGLNPNGLYGPTPSTVQLRAVIDAVPVPIANDATSSHSISGQYMQINTHSWLKPIVLTPGLHTFSVEWRFYGVPGMFGFTGAYLGWYTDWNNIFMAEVLG